MRKPLTLWLRLLIFVLLVTVLVVGAATVEMGRIWRPFFNQYPKLSLALQALQAGNAAAILAGLYTVWVLYQRRPGALIRAKIGLLARFVGTAAGALSFPWLAGLPGEQTEAMTRQAHNSVLASLVFTALALLYLMRSAKVRRIYRRGVRKKVRSIPALATRLSI